MTDTELNRFIEEEELDIDWRGDNLYLWINPCSLWKFCKVIESYIDTEIEVSLLSEGVVVIDLVPICRYFDIDAERIHEVV